jgi:hypothetical protein
MKISTVEIKPVSCPLCGAQTGQDCRFSTTCESRDGTHTLRKLEATQIFSEGTVSAIAYGSSKKK